jgi:hypothetical protein
MAADGNDQSKKNATSLGIIPLSPLVLGMNGVGGHPEIWQLGNLVIGKSSNWQLAISNWQNQRQNQSRKS